MSNEQRHTEENIVIALSNITRVREEAVRKVKPHVRLAANTDICLVAPRTIGTKCFVCRHTALVHWQRNHIVPLRRLLQQRGRVVVAVRRVSPEDVQHKHRTGEVVRPRRHSGETPARRPLQVALCSPLLVVRGVNAKHNQILPPAPRVHNEAWDVSKCCVVHCGGLRVAEVVGFWCTIIGSDAKAEVQKICDRNEENQQHGNPPQPPLHRRQFRFRHGRSWCENLGKIKKGRRECGGSRQQAQTARATTRKNTATRCHAATKLHECPWANPPRTTRIRDGADKGVRAAEKPTARRRGGGSTIRSQRFFAIPCVSSKKSHGPHASHRRSKRPPC
ncbi:hypothetical protein ECC02_006788 [Trypanosoma cruzi]|uniref:Uncharacterized protein n=1 Tax=Trypanosoma cruzi TaxID=5693 RepID=A0A7J6Y271_TRYCR|nr:hypothetical protein ECC02_006788 [Trypanosoma cruzi]